MAKIPKTVFFGITEMLSEICDPDLAKAMARRILAEFVANDLDPLKKIDHTTICQLLRDAYNAPSMEDAKPYIQQAHDTAKRMAARLKFYAEQETMDTARGSTT